MDPIMREEYGTEYAKGVLQFRVRPNHIEVFTVGKWRPLGVDFTRRSFNNGNISPRLRQQMLISLQRNGGLIPGVKPEDHIFTEVK